MTLGRRLYFSVFLALIAATAGGVLCNGVFFLRQPYQLNYGEGLVAWQASHITDATRAYAPLDRYPFVVFQYPPVFHVTARAFSAVVGNPDLLAAGRAVSLLSALGLCGVAGWITFWSLPGRAGRPVRAFAAILASALPMAFYNFEWSWLSRVDMLSILFCFSGAAVFAARPGSIPMQVAAAALLTAGLFTKQTAWAAPIACLSVAWAMDRKIFGRMLIIMGALGGSALAWLEWWTHGQALLHLIRYNQVAFSLLRAGQGVFMNVRHMAGVLFLAAGTALPVLLRASRLVRRGRRELLATNLRANRYRRTVLLFAAYSVLAALISLTFGKEGSDINYFLDWNFALTPLAGILLFRVLNVLRGPFQWKPAPMAALVVPFLLLQPGFDRARDGWIRAWKGPLPADSANAQVYQRMLGAVRQAGDKPVFSEDMNVLYKAGKDIPAEPATIQCLAKAGIWDETAFVKMIREKRFSLILAHGGLSMEHYSPAVAAAISDSYKVTGSAGEYEFYEPPARH